MLFPRLSQSNPPKYTKEDLGGFDRDLPWPEQPEPITIAHLFAIADDGYYYDDYKDGLRARYLQQLFHVVSPNHKFGVRYCTQVKKGTPGSIVHNRRSYIVRTGPVAVGPSLKFENDHVMYVARVYALEGVRFQSYRVRWYPIGQVFEMPEFHLSEWCDELIKNAVERVQQNLID